MQTQSSDENSVSLSVGLSNAWIVTKQKKNLSRFFMPYEISFSVVFWEEKWLVEGLLLPEILGQPAPVGAKSPILNRYSLVAPQP